MAAAALATILKIHTEIDGDTLRVTLSGEFDVDGLEAFRAALREAPEEWSCVAIDLSEVEFMDSSGLGALVHLSLRGREVGFDVTLVRPSLPVMRLLELTGLETHFAVRD